MDITEKILAARVTYKKTVNNDLKKLFRQAYCFDCQ